MQLKDENLSVFKLYAVDLSSSVQWLILKQVQSNHQN